MRMFPVDERDSSWESHEPRFRLYVFDGPDNAVTTWDIVEASIREALDLAHTASENDARLWSLALVQDSAGGRGLVWLTGMDYNDAPATARERRQRREMQDRFLSAKAKAKAGGPLQLPDGLRVLRVFPEWIDGWPLWESFSDSYNLTAADLGLSDGLSDDLLAWNRAWVAHAENDSVPDAWRERGSELVERLRGELGDVFDVRPEFL
jgi:hypothetical protein